MVCTNVLWVVGDDNDAVFTVWYLRSKGGGGHVVTCFESTWMEMGVALTPWVARSRSSSDAFADGFVDGFKLSVNQILLSAGFCLWYTPYTK